MKRKLARSLLITTLLLSVGHAEARGPWRASEENTRGWLLMTPPERIEHQARIRSFSTWEACLAYQQAHHLEMESRAKEKGLALSPGGRDICAHLKPADRTP